MKQIGKGWNANGVAKLLCRSKTTTPLKERGQEVGIQHFNLDRLASNTLASHRVVQWMTKHYGCVASEALYNELNHNHFIEGMKLNDLPFCFARRLPQQVLTASRAMHSLQAMRAFWRLSRHKLFLSV